MQISPSPNISLRLTTPTIKAMMPLLPLLLLAMSFGMSHSTLPPPERSYNILMLTPFSCRSHLNMFIALATGLTQRGHKITLLSNYPAYDDNPNITYITHNLTSAKQERVDLFSLGKNYFKTTKKLITSAIDFGQKFYEIPEIKALYESRDQFDLFIVENYFHDIVFPFVYKKPFITMAPSGFDHLSSITSGNTVNPASVSALVKDFKIPMSFFNKLVNLCAHIAFPLGRYITSTAPLVLQVSRMFPELPSLNELDRNQTLVLLNSHFSIFGPPVPMLPGQVEVGGIHIKPPKPLPQDIQDFVSGDVPVIYMSTGSVIQIKDVPAHYKEILLSVFRRLPYKVIWHYDEYIEDQPKHLMTKDWVPQQDLLAHPNVKLFVSHCGLSGLQEAVMYAIPMVCLPVFADQHRNAGKIQNYGLGLELEWYWTTEEVFYNAIMEILTNTKYRDAMRKVSVIYRDRPESPLERGIYWTEYVIRHKGAPLLRSLEHDLSYIQLLHLDILLVLALVLYLNYRLVKFCFSRWKKNSKTKI